MKANHQYIVDMCEQMVPEGGRILDYGCGRGQVVAEGVNRGLDIYGVEAFAYGSGGTLVKDHLESIGLLGERVKDLNLEDNLIPFPDRHFDLIVSNQVFEHVVNIELALSQVHRVLKDDDQILFLFPSMEVIKEGHCGVLFAHWLPKSTLRYYWLLFNRCLGIGRLKGKRTRRQWASFFNDWLVDSVTYRSIRTLHREFGKFFTDLNHIEGEYMNYRLKLVGRNRLASWTRFSFFRTIYGFICRRWGGLIFTANKKIDAAGD